VAKPTYENRMTETVSVGGTLKCTSNKSIPVETIPTNITPAVTTEKSVYQALLDLFLGNP
jgi:hypothetical protein